jgi:pimeloyl-ACP methyl ester carboxylesterase
MPTAQNNGVSLYYEVEGDGDTVVFLGELGYGAWQWGWQHAAVAGPYEALVMDLRGAGRSDAPAGPYTVPHLARDVQAVLEDHGTRRAHLVGVGLGGMVALELARISGRPRSLFLIGTVAAGEGLNLDPLFGPPDDPAQLERSLEAALSPAFRDRHPDVIDQIVEWRAREDADRAAWEAQRAAVDAFDSRDVLHEITDPVQVVHGSEDRVYPVDRGRLLAEQLPRGEFVEATDAGHLANVEHSKVVNDELLWLLDEVA